MKELNGTIEGNGLVLKFLDGFYVHLVLNNDLLLEILDLLHFF